MPRARLLACLAAVVACDSDPAVHVETEVVVPDIDTCAPVTDWDHRHAALEDDLQDALNNRRAEGGRCGQLVFPPAPPVYMDPALRCAARLHSQDMATRAYVGEVDPDGVGIAARLALVGYEDAATFAENVGFGYASADDALELWADSAANCWKLYARELTDIGVGLATGQYTQKDKPSIRGPYWTVTFAAADS